MMLPPVAILAGGLGTRLGEVTRDVPKPMIEVAGKPFLEHVIRSFTDRGFARFVLLVGHQAEVVEAWFGGGGRLGIDIRYSREASPLGTGGAVREAASLLGDRFVLTYGDVLRRFDYDRFVTASSENCLAVYRHERGMRTDGNVDVDREGRVSAFVKDGGLPWVDAGFSAIHTRELELLPSSGACSFEAIVYPALAAQHRLRAEVVDLEFFDIGNPSDLARTRSMLEAR